MTVFPPFSCDAVDVDQRVEDFEVYLFFRVAAF